MSDVSFREAFKVWLQIGLTSFGGPAGQIAMMHRILVDERRWIDERRYLHALNYCMLLPGPEAQQLATYVGWLLHGVRGGLVAGTLFVLPGALVMLGLAALYAGFREVGLVQWLFFGIKAAVLAVVLEAVVRIGRRVLKTPAMLSLSVLSFVAIFALQVPFPAIVLSAGIIGLAGGRLWPRAFAVSADDVGPVVGGPRPSWGRFWRVTGLGLALWWTPIAVLALWLGLSDVFVQVGLFFSKLAVVTFGGAYAVLAYMAQATVETYGWLQPGEMVDGLGLAETTPGPLILVTQFVGFLAAHRFAGGLDPMLAGVLGALLTTWVTFVPCFLWIFLGAPYVERLRANARLSAALTAITAAVLGVIVNLAVWFGLHVLFGTLVEMEAGPLRLLLPAPESLDVWAAGLAIVAVVALLRLHLGLFWTLALCAALGVARGWLF
jgi:chromate transporter